MVRQHDGQCQSSTGYQGVAQGAFIADDGINAGEHNGSGRDKEYSTDNRTRNAGKNIGQLGAQTICQEDYASDLSDAAGANTGSGNDADILGVAGAGQTAEESGDHAAQAFSKDAAVDVLNAIDLIAGSAGSGVVTNRFEHGSNIAGEAADDSGTNKGDGGTALTFQTSVGEQLGQCEPRSIVNGFPIEHAKSGGANNANNDNGDENEALGKQTFATAELKNQSQQEGYSGHDEALSILRGESPLNSDTGSYITDSCYYGTNYNRGEELADLAHNAGAAQQSFQCAADNDGAPDSGQTIGSGYAAHGGGEGSRRALNNGQAVTNGSLNQCADTHDQEACADHGGQNGGSIQTGQGDKHTAPYKGGKVYQSNLDGKVERFPPGGTSSMP